MYIYRLVSFLCGIKRPSGFSAIFCLAMATRTRYIIAGYSGCGFHSRASELARLLAEEFKSLVDVEVITKASRNEFRASLPVWKKELGPTAASHNTSPIVWKEVNGQKEFIGGCDAFTEFQSKFRAQQQADNNRSFL